MTASTLQTSDILTWKIRGLLVLFSLSTLFFSQNYCVNVCPFIDGLSNDELISNLFVIFLLHIAFREILYRYFATPFQGLSLPRHTYYLSILSWMLAGVAGFLLHFFKYPGFPIGSHLKLLSSYWVLGGGILAQLEYILFERQYKKLAITVHLKEYRERISRRIVESFLILTLAPSITILLVLIRYLEQGNYDVHMILEIGYIILLFISVAAICSVYFGRMLQEDTGEILHSINTIKQGQYNIHIPIKRADELEEISDAIELMAHDIGALHEEIAQTQAEVVHTMGEIAETRSKETGNHVKRVAEYSELLALQYGMSAQEAALLRQASPMHDIGKVGIPDLILNKPGRHTEDEFAIMKTHAQLGYDILKNSQRPVLQTAAIVAHEHHEKWNGHGYPRGLKGEEIHIYGRITAVADVFDALGSDRCYKKAWEDDKIFQLFQEESGQHFDPRLITLFFDNIEAIKEIRERFKDKFTAHAAT